MIDRRQRNIEIFEDTLNQIQESKLLSQAVDFSIKSTKVYAADEYPQLENNSVDQNVIVTKSRTFEAAINLSKKYPNKRIAVLNFASSTTPGGGVKWGSSAQEEALCRCSTLYPVLSTNYVFKNFYLKNRNRYNALNTDDIVYSKDIVICKNDIDYPTRMLEKDYVKVDVLTCAAPNLKERPSNDYNISNGDQVSISDEELYKLHLSRAKHILHIAAFNKVEILILGAFGCGAFRNNPWVVAKAYKDALKEYDNNFFLVDFAIYTRPNEEENYNAFIETFGQ